MCTDVMIQGQPHISLFFLDMMESSSHVADAFP